MRTNITKVENRLIVIILLLFGSWQTASAQTGKENLMIVWPEEYKWKVGSKQEDQTMHMLQLIPGNETIEKWTIIGTMLSIKGATNVPVDEAMDVTFARLKENAPKAKLTLIEKDEKSKNPWILFKIESPEFKSDKTPESQLYYVVQGNQSLYSNLVAIKEKSLSQEFIEKWSKVFKAGALTDHE